MINTGTSNVKNCQLIVNVGSPCDVQHVTRPEAVRMPGSQLTMRPSHDQIFQITYHKFFKCSHTVLNFNTIHRSTPL